MSGRLPLMKQLVSLKAAAKHVGKRRAYIKALVDAEKLKAFRIGGTAESPLLGVRLDEAESVVALEMQYQPPGRPRRRAARPDPTTKLNRRVRC